MVSEPDLRDAPVGDPAEHYGDPAREQRALEDGSAVVALSHRGIVAVAGPDRLSWLDSLTSQSLTGLPPGASAESLLLDPQGRIEHAFGVVDDGETAWLLVHDVERARSLAAFLARMRFMLRVDVAEVSHEFSVFGSFGQVGPATAVWRDPWAHVVEGGWQYAVATPHPGATWTWAEAIVTREDAEVWAQRPRAGTLALDALRIAAWRPSVAELDDRSLPHEFDWMRTAVHLAKGCYRGQETVAKVHNLGHPPRRLVFVHLDGSDVVLPAPGDALFSRGSDGEPSADAVGRVTSVARHAELGPIALALVKRATLEGDAFVVVTAGGERVAAAIESIVPSDAGAVADVPRIPRLRSASRA